VEARSIVHLPCNWQRGVGGGNDDSKFALAAILFFFPCVSSTSVPRMHGWSRTQALCTLPRLPLSCTAAPAAQPGCVRVRESAVGGLSITQE
jgi:hypothetical protein